MSSTPMQVDSPAASLGNGHLSLKSRGPPPSAKVSDVIATFTQTKLWRREHKSAPTTITSLDFDDSGDHLLTSESDESLHVYNVKEGTHSKQCLSKKYGVKLAKFSHSSTSVIYASTKENDTLRYLSTHDNNFIRYFKGHEAAVTCIAINPGDDTFVSCAQDDTVRLWNANTENCVGKLHLAQPYLAAFDPSASVLAIGSEAAQTILLYDFRQFDKEPFAAFDMLSLAREIGAEQKLRGWNKLEFSNDGKSLLIGTTGLGHFLLDAFDGKLRAYLSRPRGGPARLAPGEQNRSTSAGLPSKPRAESSGDVVFSPDGRYVLSGQKGKDVLVWDTQQAGTENNLKVVHELECKTEAGVLEFNPRYNMFASGDKEVIFWVPDLNAVEKP